MAEEEKTDKVKQENAFSLIEQRDALIDKVYESAEENDSTEAPEEAPEEAEEEVEDTIPEVDEPETKPSDYEKLQEEFENKTNALTEEREKRKAKARELESVQNQLHEVLQDYKNLSAEVEKLKSGDDYEEEPGANAMATEIKNLKKELSELKRDRDGEKQKSATERYMQSLTNTDKTLLEEGYPGFYIMRAAVQDELVKMVKEDPDNAIYDNPDGWKKIYREKVWPTVSQHFTKITNEKKIEDKKKAKEKANLITLPGNKPENKDAKDEDWTYQDYLKMRRGTQLS